MESKYTPSNLPASYWKHLFACESCDRHSRSAAFFLDRETSSGQSNYASALEKA